MSQPEDGPADPSTQRAARRRGCRRRAPRIVGRRRPPVRQRSELEIRWRQARNAPPPVVRAVLANVAVALVGGVVLLLVDWLAGQGLLPEAWASVAPVIYVALVIVSGSLLTYLWVELPTGRAGERRRSGWSAGAGLLRQHPHRVPGARAHLPGAAAAPRVASTRVRQRDLDRGC